MCDYACDDSSLPPSSSPPQLFSSSPCAFSQSSVIDVEPKMMLAVEEECTHIDHVILPSQDEPRLESQDSRSLDIVDVTALPEAATCIPEVDPSSYIESDIGTSKKRATYQSDQDGSDEDWSNKRPKLDPDIYPPPAPKRATLASQRSQFKKLSAPFRPPFRIPVAVDGLLETKDNDVETNIRSTSEINHHKSDLRKPTSHPFSLQLKSSNPQRSITQFKSPLVTRVPSSVTRTIRLTPAVQALERKLQVLKRAIKVKECKEEEILVRLASKWVEAGREAAYDVWDAARGTTDFEEKVIFRRSYTWEKSNDGNLPWGWDNKPGDDLDSSRTPCTAGRPATGEDDNDVGCYTLGTMLRQLGIALEIFGWDDDKEAFSDSSIV